LIDKIQLALRDVGVISAVVLGVVVIRRRNIGGYAVVNLGSGNETAVFGKSIALGKGVVLRNKFNSLLFTFLAGFKKS
jgi:hypothetical protein